jgi:hypothetical protein
MSDPLDYTQEYRDRIRPEINRRLKRVFLSFIGCVLLLIVASKILDYFGLPDKLIFVLFFPCAGFYLHQIFSFKNIRCPHCNKPLLTLANIGKIPLISKSYVGKHCPHCPAKLR